MTVRVDLKQEKTIEEGPVYRVTNTVTYSNDIQSQVFVINTELETFSHVGTVWDLQNYPSSRTAAISEGVPYYLASQCSQDYDNIDDALAFTSHVYGRVEWLVREYEEANDVFEGVLTHTITG